jgi:signal transduction histidine kinase
VDRLRDTSPTGCITVAVSRQALVGPPVRECLAHPAMTALTHVLTVARPLYAYASGIGFMALALFVRWLLDPYLGEAQPLSLLFGAVALTVWIAGLGPALCATVFGYFCSDYMFMEPRGVIAIRSVPQMISLLTYAVSSAVIIAFGEALRRAKARVDAYAQSLEAKQRQLERAERNKDDFIATLGHELRSPLTAIIHASAFLNRKLLFVHETKDALGILNRQAQQMKRLIEDLLDLTRVARGELRLARCEVPIAEVIANAVDAARPAMELRGHDLTVRAAAVDARVDGDPVRLTQVFTNLLSNAARYTPHAGTICITTRIDSRHVVVSVRDSGVGIAQQKMERLFEMFFQADERSEHHRQGLGIGLALVRRIVELHGGTVIVHSDGIGLGSEFTVRLPVVLRAGADQLSGFGCCERSIAAQARNYPATADGAH